MILLKEAIFADVIDEFSSIFSVIMHFRRWKYSFKMSYEQAYISLCLPKLLEPYVSYQLISWNVLSADSNIESMMWVQDLLFFIKQGNKVEYEDTDVLFIPQIIDNIIIPKLSGKM